MTCIQVGSVNFSSSFDQNAGTPAKCTTFSTNMVSIDCRADILSADRATQKKVSTLLILQEMSLLHSLIPFTYTCLTHQLIHQLYSLVLATLDDVESKVVS